MVAVSWFITSLEFTSGNTNVGHQFYTLVDCVLDDNLAFETYTNDKVYDNRYKHYYLTYHYLNQVERMLKKNKNKQLWEELYITSKYLWGSKQHFKFLRKFGEAKTTCFWSLSLSRIIRLCYPDIIHSHDSGSKSQLMILTGFGFKTSIGVAM